MNKLIELAYEKYLTETASTLERTTQPEIAKQYCSCEEDFIHSLNCEQLQHFVRLSELRENDEEMKIKDAYKTGFSTGLRIMWEISADN